VRLVRSRVAEFFERQPDVTVDPLEAVALGAAAYGARLVGQRVCEPGLPHLLAVSPATLVVDDEIGRVVLFEKNEPLPASASHRFPTVRDDQTELRVEVHAEADDVREPLLTLTIDELPPALAGSVVVEGVFKLDEDHLLTARLIDPASGKLVTARAKVPSKRPR
jgi:molecular chaperone HscA